MIVFTCKSIANRLSLIHKIIAALEKTMRDKKIKYLIVIIYALMSIISPVCLDINKSSADNIVSIINVDVCDSMKYTGLSILNIAAINSAFYNLSNYFNVIYKILVDSINLYPSFSNKIDKPPKFTT
ncbi:membrane protein [Candidatus Magnetoovum chiemensis]|nr:membrane protein [Candidatus Magnetoovum chiemensis]